MGLRKTAKKTVATRDLANTACRTWTKSPDGEEFFVRYYNDVGYGISSYERGLLCLFRRSKDMASAMEGISLEVLSKGRSWELPVWLAAYKPSQEYPDVRVWIADGGHIKAGKVDPQHMTTTARPNVFVRIGRGLLRTWMALAAASIQMTLGVLRGSLYVIGAMLVAFVLAGAIQWAFM